MTENESCEFDWLDDASDVVVRAQPTIAIYPGPAGVVIRREGDLWCDDGDDVIWFAVEQVPTIVTAILEAAGLNIADLMPDPTPVGSKRKDTTAAEREGCLI